MIQLGIFQIIYDLWCTHDEHYELYVKVSGSNLCQLKHDSISKNLKEDEDLTDNINLQHCLFNSDFILEWGGMADDSRER